MPIFDYLVERRVNILAASNPFVPSGISSRDRIPVLLIRSLDPSDPDRGVGKCVTVIPSQAQGSCITPLRPINDQ